MNIIKKVQEEIGKLGANYCALVISPENRRYLTGFESSNGYLIINRDNAVFITDGRYIEAAQNRIKDCETVIQEKIYPQLAKILEELHCGHLLVESGRMTLSVYNSLCGCLKKLSIHTDTTLDTIIGDLRAVKEDWEIENIRKAQKITDEAFNHICGFIKPGISEKDIELELGYYMLSHGGEALSFETIAISGKNTSMPHGVPTDKIVENGEFITMDFGTVVNGYHSDMTRTVVLGSPDGKMKKVYDTVLSAQLNCIENIKAGMTGQEGDSLSRDIIEKAGYGDYFTHSTGHSVGVEIHENPNLSPLDETILRPGNIVTVEPGIYIPGEFGVRIEDMVVITESGCEVLTASPKNLISL